MISRHWKGIARNDVADDYIRHLTEDTLPKLSALPGFLRACILRRARAEGVEFLIVTEWESLAAICAFAGEDAEAAVVPPIVQSMMFTFDSRVEHYEVVATHSAGY